MENSLVVVLLNKSKLTLIVKIWDMIGLKTSLFVTYQNRGSESSDFKQIICLESYSPWICMTYFPLININQTDGL